MPRVETHRIHGHDYQIEIPEHLDNPTNKQGRWALSTFINDTIAGILRTLSAAPEYETEVARNQAELMQRLSRGKRITEETHLSDLLPGSYPSRNVHFIEERRSSHSSKKDRKRFRREQAQHRHDG